MGGCNSLQFICSRCSRSLFALRIRRQTMADRQLPRQRMVQMVAHTTKIWYVYQFPYTQCAPKVKEDDDHDMLGVQPYFDHAWCVLMCMCFTMLYCLKKPRVNCNPFVLQFGKARTSGRGGWRNGGRSRPPRTKPKNSSMVERPLPGKRVSELSLQKISSIIISLNDSTKKHR